MSMHTQSLTDSAGAGDLKFLAIKAVTQPCHTDYQLTPEQAAFFKGETGIDDDENLRVHILAVQKKAYKVFPYPCIGWFLFLKHGMATHPEYKNIIKLGQDHQNVILLDIGCCFGVDARKAIADGFPLKNVVTADLEQEFFDMGHALFNTTPESYPISFVPGDVFDPNILRIVPPFNEPPSTERPDLSTLTSLNPLAGRCTVIYAANLFHLFSEENQLHLAKALAGLLSPRPGSTICGEHIGNRKKGVYPDNLSKAAMFRHSPKSWRTIWDGKVFAEGSVRVNVTLLRVKMPAMPTRLRLRWSVVRL